MEQLVANLRLRLQGRHRPARLDEPGDQGSRRRQKLAAFTPKIGYPNKWRDYSKVQVVRDDLVGNMMRAQAAEFEYQLAKVGKPVDRDEWGMTPQTVNAYYNPVRNEIVFPAAILQPPFFNMAADDAVNYGGDRRGDRPRDGPRLRRPGPAVRRHRHDARLVDRRRTARSSRSRPRGWWRSSSAYEVLPGLKVNGELTLGENIGDLTGLDHRLPRLPDVARRQAGAGHRRPDRRPALLHGLGAGLARQDARRRAAAAGADRRALAGEVSAATGRSATCRSSTRRSA